MDLMWEQNWAHCSVLRWVHHLDLHWGSCWEHCSVLHWDWHSERHLAGCLAPHWVKQTALH